MLTVRIAITHTVQIIKYSSSYLQLLKNKITIDLPILIYLLNNYLDYLFILTFNAIINV